MKRLLPLLLLSLLAACATLAPQPANQAESNAAQPDDRDVVGRIGPDGGPLIADRGIGGTGAPMPGRLMPGGLMTGGPVPGGPVPGGPVTSSSTSQTADRGIGGTGGPMTGEEVTASPSQIADRGIGGTGVVGVVTGFGSVFVNGLEIQYDNAAAVDIDGTPSSVAVLRVGQLVALRAQGPATAPYATAISVRSEVIGRIEGVELGSGTLTIAGQSVSVPDGTWGANQFGPGDWVKVSGLRRQDGTVLASRLDSAPGGMLLVHGQAVGDGGTMHVGRLMLGGAAPNNVQNGQFVIVSGDYASGRLHVGAVASDTLSASPADYFGPSTNRLIVQAFVHIDNGTVSMNGTKISAASAVAAGLGHEGIAVVSLRRGADGSYVASDLRYAGYRSQSGRGLRGGGRSGRGDGSQHGGHAQAASPASDPADSGSVVTGAASSTGEIEPVNAVASAPAAPVIVAKLVMSSSPSVTNQAPAPWVAAAYTPTVVPVATALITTPVPTTPTVTPAPIVAPVSTTPTVTPAPIFTPVSPTPTPVLQSVPSVAPLVVVPSAGGVFGVQFGSAHVGFRFPGALKPWPIGGRGDTDVDGTHTSEGLRAHNQALRDKNERSRNNVGAGGSTSGQTIDLHTGGATSVKSARGRTDKATNSKVAMSGAFMTPSSSAKGVMNAPLIGTASGKAPVARGDRSHGH